MIKHVTIKKLWGIKNISTDFYHNVNIFIGSNGSNKTTFLKLIEATLSCDINIFLAIEFEYISIDFIDEKINSLVVKRRVLNGDRIIVHYCIDNEIEYNIPCSEMVTRLAQLYNKNYHTLKEKLNQCINLSWLSINRDTFSSRNESGTMNRTRNMVDIKLHDLTRQLMQYQLRLELDSNENTNRFKEEVLSLMLYDENFDKLNGKFLSNIKSVDINLMEEDLYKAFNTLGVAKDKSESIKKHVSRIKEVVKRTSAQNSIRIEDVLILSLINRTISIINISKEHEEQNAVIFKPINHFWNSLKKFMPDKNFVMNKDGNINVEIMDNNNNTIPINITSLSSGEKQLFILLTEALLEKGKRHLYIADEPELSLHIEWQQKILSELLSLNPNAQIIVATHSPEIAGNFPDNVINMKKIISYE